MKTLLALFLLLTISERNSDSEASARIGQMVTFSVTSDGSKPLNYKWYKFIDDSELAMTPLISNESSGQFTLANIQPSDAGRYLVQVSNAAGSTMSDTATITVSPMLATLTATVTSNNYPPPALYQWRLNGQTITGANQPTYSFDPAVKPGSYSLTLTWPNIPTVP